MAEMKKRKEKEKKKKKGGNETFFFFVKSSENRSFLKLPPAIEADVAPSLTCDRGSL